MSIWPRFTPCRAQVGSAWCRLCHDSPKESTASHQTFAERSRAANGRVAAMWQIELIDQVTWCSSATRTSPAQKNAVSAPHQDQLTRPPMQRGQAEADQRQQQEQPVDGAMSRSASRSGAKRRALVLSRSNSQPMWACQKPLDQGDRPGAEQPRRVRVALLVGERVVAAVVGDPADDAALEREAAGDGERDPQRARRLERAVGEVAMEPDGDARAR